MPMISQNIQRGRVPNPHPSMRPHQRPKKEKPEGLGDDLIRQCRDFLSIEVPSSNIVFVDEFSKYIPLFNKEAYERTDPNDIDHLAREYNSRFSMQHPIQILRREIDPNGIYHQGTRKKHKLDHTIPPMFRRVSTLNNLGKKIPALINAFMNASSKDTGPGDPRKQQYAHAIAQAISMADKKEGKIDKQRADFRRSADALIHDRDVSTSPKQDTPSEDSETGLIEWD